MKLTTTVYKYKRFAPWMIGLLAFATILFFFLSPTFPPIMNVIGVALLIFGAVYSALRPKSIFSLRTVDDRKLTITPDELIWGTVIMPINEVKKLEIYIHAFDAFRHRSSGSSMRKLGTSEYGDKNTIAFMYRDIRYDFIFYLGTFDHYDILVQIIQGWRDKGIDLSARSAFSDSYIREQNSIYG